MSMCKNCEMENGVPTDTHCWHCKRELPASDSSAGRFLHDALGGNMNFGTLKPLAIEEIMEQYARQEIKKERKGDKA